MSDIARGCKITSLRASRNEDKIFFFKLSKRIFPLAFILENMLLNNFDAISFIMRYTDQSSYFSFPFFVIIQRRLIIIWFQII